MRLRLVPIAQHLLVRAVFGGFAAASSGATQVRGVEAPNASRIGRDLPLSGSGEEFEQHLYELLGCLFGLVVPGMDWRAA
jgi:hypothetical protein